MKEVCAFHIVALKSKAGVRYIVFHLFTLCTLMGEREGGETCHFEADWARGVLVCTPSHDGPGLGEHWRGSSLTWWPGPGGALS